MDQETSDKKRAQGWRGSVVAVIPNLTLVTLGNLVALDELIERLQSDPRAEDGCEISCETVLTEIVMQARQILLDARSSKSAVAKTGLGRGMLQSPMNKVEHQATVVTLAMKDFLWQWVDHCRVSINQRQPTKKSQVKLQDARENFDGALCQFMIVHDELLHAIRTAGDVEGAQTVILEEDAMQGVSSALPVNDDDSASYLVDSTADAQDDTESEEEHAGVRSAITIDSIPIPTGQSPTTDQPENWEYASLGVRQLHDNEMEDRAGLTDADDGGVQLWESEVDMFDLRHWSHG